MQNELISQGVSLMLLGMGVVFVFLTLLVFATSTMSRIVEKYFPEPHSITPASSSPIPSEGAQVDPRILAAIKAAIAEHRSKTRQQ